VGTSTVSPLVCSSLTSPILRLGLAASLMLMFEDAESSMWTESADLSLPLVSMVAVID
jgi:hypothetical protein